MARPLKSPANKFLFDVDFFGSPEMIYISETHGEIGELVAIKLLCDIYRNGYYIEWGKAEQIKLLKQMPNVSKQKICDIVETLVECGFFDLGMLREHRVLTSATIQQTHLETQRKYRRSAHISKYAIIECHQPTKEDITPTHQEQTSIETTPSETPIIEDSDTPITRLLTDSMWQESVCMRYHIEPNSFAYLVEEFRQHTVCYDQAIESVAEAKRYFCNWYRKAYPISVKTKPPPQQADFTDVVGFGSIDI